MQPVLQAALVGESAEFPGEAFGPRSRSPLDRTGVDEGFPEGRGPFLEYGL